MANLTGKKIRFNQSTEYNTALTTYSAGHVYFTNNNNDTNNNAIILEGKIYGAAPMVELQYSQLTALVTNKKLIPGTNYKITNYVTTTSQTGTTSAGIPFDIIVTAISNDALSEDAKADYHGNSFSQQNISAWELKYCLYNDTARFEWASSTGTGVIYYMKDEYNNEAWYDFKNIKFLRTADFFNTNSFLAHLEGDNYYFTFSNIVNNKIIDGSVYNENITISIQNKIDKINGTNYSLNNTIFINDSSGYTRYNNIEFGNHSNTFGSKCQANNILQHCYNNVIGNMFRNNVIDQYFCNNKVSGQFEYNTLGIQCYNNSFSGHIWFTIFGSQFNYCSFNIPEGSKLEYCDFGSGIGFLNGIPAIRKVKFENNVAWYDTTTYVNNLYTIDGITLAQALTQEHDDQLYVYKVGDKYGVTSFSEMNNVVTIEDKQTITGEKTFTQNIKINEKDIIISGDTKICGSIDAGELKVLDNRTANKGFTIRTESSTVNGLYPVQLLATNNAKSVQYKFPVQGPQSHVNSTLVNYPVNKPINVITECSYATPSIKGISYICDAFTGTLETPNPAYINSNTSLSTTSAKNIVDNLITYQQRVSILESNFMIMTNDLNIISNDFNVMSTATAEALVDLDNRITNISFDTIQKQIDTNTTAIANLNNRLNNLETLVNKIADALTIK